MIETLKRKKRSNCAENDEDDDQDDMYVDEDEELLPLRSKRRLNRMEAQDDDYTECQGRAIKTESCSSSSNSPTPPPTKLSSQQVPFSSCRVTPLSLVSSSRNSSAGLASNSSSSRISADLPLTQSPSKPAPVTRSSNARTPVVSPPIQHHRDPTPAALPQSTFTFEASRRSALGLDFMIREFKSAARGGQEQHSNSHALVTAALDAIDQVTFALQGIGSDDPDLKIIYTLQSKLIIVDASIRRGTFVDIATAYLSDFGAELEDITRWIRALPVSQSPTP